MEEIENPVDSNEINLIERSTVDENREEIKTLQESKQQVVSEFNQKLEADKEEFEGKLMEVKAEMKNEVEEKMKEGLEKPNLDEIERFKLKLQDQVDKLKKSVDLLNGDLVRERKLVSEMGTIMGKLDLQVKESSDLKSVLIQNGLSEVETEENEKLVKGKEFESVKKSVEKKLAESLKGLDDLKQDKEDRIVLRKENIEKNRNYQLSKIDDLEKYVHELVAKIATLEKNDKMLGSQLEERDESFQRLLGEKCLFEQKLVDLGKMFEELKRKKGEIVAEKNKIDKQLVDSEKMVEELIREKDEIVAEKNNIEKNKADQSVKVLIQVNVKRKMILTFLLVLLIFMFVPAEVEGRVWTVGGKDGWRENINYTQWKQNISFFMGDSLLFIYDSNQLNVLQVNKANYEICNEEKPVRSWKTGVGRKLVPLKIKKDYYFISGNGYCENGVKLWVQVLDISPPSTNSAGQVKVFLLSLVLVFVSILLS